MVFGFSPPTFFGACSRLYDSGLGPTAQDWVCHYAPQGVHPGAFAAALLLAAGLAFPGVILAMTGCRTTALLPLAVLIIRDRSILSLWWGPQFLQRHPLAGQVVIFALLATPAIAIMLAGKVPPRKRSTEPLRSRVLAAVICLLLGALVSLPWVTFLQVRIPATDWFGLANLSSPDFPQINLLLSGSLFSMALFGALIGRDRRWVPWSLVVAAILISGGPSAALWRWNREASAGAGFISALALFVAASVGSAWPVVSASLAMRMTRAERMANLAAAVRQEPPVGATSRIRWLNIAAVAALCACLVLSVLMVGIDSTIAIPTYLGQRNQANDYRTKLDLQMALDDMDAYFARNGTYEGFDSAYGWAAHPELAWQDGLVTPREVPEGMPKAVAKQQTPKPSPPTLTMMILGNSRTTAKIVAMSPAGTAFCVRHERGASPTFGQSDRPTGNRKGLSAAVSSCDSAPWDAEALGAPPTLACDPDARGYLLCRMVQNLIQNILRTTNPQVPLPLPVYSTVELGRGITLAPPASAPPDTGPGSISWATRVALPKPPAGQQVEARFGLFSDLRRPAPGGTAIEGVPSWIITVPGGCPRPPGADPYRSPNYNCHWNTVVDARNDKVVERFASRVEPSVSAPPEASS
jgi:type II secretory pathway pseudopilin PulG